MLVSSEATPPVSMGGVETEESVWESRVGGLAPIGERTVTLGRRLGVFLTAWRAVTKRQRQRGCEREWIDPFVIRNIMWYHGHPQLQRNNPLSCFLKKYIYSVCYEDINNILMYCQNLYHGIPGTRATTCTTATSITEIWIWCFQIVQWRLDFLKKYTSQHKPTKPTLICSFCGFPLLLCFLLILLLLSGFGETNTLLYLT